MGRRKEVKEEPEVGNPKDFLEEERKWKGKGPGLHPSTAATERDKAQAG